MAGADLSRWAELVGSTPAWRDQAACRGAGAELWFSAHRSHQARALAICSGCPVRSSCLAAALAAEGDRPAGIFGGLTAAERDRIRRGTSPPPWPAAALQPAGT